ncbi:MAG: nickel pincer cofactor biosynthesis protein LarC [Acidobacteria bacterium]|nr:nickel pincer cofactor biosynthesis protein LarC [Acidobacteriota bacterium]
MKTLYFDLFAGCSGDMILGALVDAGVDFEQLRNQLACLPLKGYTLQCIPVNKRGIRATQVVVHLDHEPETPQPAPATDGSAPPPAHHHHHGSAHDSPAQPAPPHPQPVTHEHRHFADIRRMILESSLPAPVTRRALAIFENLARAEAHIHQTTIDKVAFHEVGAVDSIVDIVGISLGLHQLGIDRFACSPVNVGSGTVRCAHGILPVPAPATAALLEGFPIYAAHFHGEMTTPTGAAVLKTLVPLPGKMPAGTLQALGYGAGTRDLEDGANVLRIMIIDETPAADAVPDGVRLLECNLDDMNPEHTGELAQRLLAEGALDVWLTPIQMKKFRPGVCLSLLCRAEQAERLTDLLLQHSTTFGVRRSAWERTELQRRQLTIGTRLGPVSVKAGWHGERLLKVTPEFESCRQVAERQHLSLADVCREVERAIGEHWTELARRHPREDT